MYQVLIVEDEYPALDKICTMINWENHGFHIAGTAADGHEAIDFINANKVDVVFTDICMPNLDGITLTRHISENFPSIKVVIMSSYSDFNYIKECFAAKAVDYVLKHLLNADELIKILDTLSAAYLQNADQTGGYDEYIKAQKYQNDIISAVKGESAAGSVPDGIVAAVRPGNHSLLKFIHSAEESKNFYKHIINTVSQVLKNLDGVVIFSDANDIIFIYIPLGTMHEPKIMNLLREYIKQTDYSVKKFFDISLKWGISCVSSKEYPLSSCRAEALEMLERTPIVNKKYIAPPEFVSLSSDDEKNIISAVQASSTDNANHALEAIFKRVPPQQLALNIIVSELITLANKICLDFGIDILSLSKILTDLKQSANSSVSKDEILSLTQNLFHSIISEIGNNDVHTRKYSSLAKEYIAQHYAEDIILKQIADKIGITETYLSAVFKGETGDTVSNYITHFRIDKAKELLMKNVDIKFLYSAVGFRNYNYFFSTFKRVTGYTPRQYKNMHKHKT